MEEVIRIIQHNGIWVFLVGFLTSIIIGIVKTPIRKKVITDSLAEEEKKKRENLFDTITYISSYLLAFIGAMVYCLIVEKGFHILSILGVTLPVYLSQSICYGIWKKLSLKRLFQLILKLFIKDRNKDGKVTLDEALEQVKDAYKNGKLDVDKLVSDITDNANETFPEVVEEVVSESGIAETEEVQNTVKAIEGDSSNLNENLSEAVKSAAEQVSMVNKTGNDDVVVAKKSIKF